MADRPFVEAFGRGLAILEALSRQERPLTNGELARATGLPLSTVSRLTYTAIALGYVRPSAGRRAYQLTPKCLTLGYPVLAGLPGLDIIRPLLKRLSERTGETVAYVIRDKLHVTFVEVATGDSDDAIRIAPGGRLPISAAAAGVALLTALPASERRTVVARLRAEMGRRGRDVVALDRNLRTAAPGRAFHLYDAWRMGISGIAKGFRLGGEAAAVTLAVPTSHLAGPGVPERLEEALSETVSALELSVLSEARAERSTRTLRAGSERRARP